MICYLAAFSYDDIDSLPARWRIMASFSSTRSCEVFRGTRKHHTTKQKLLRLLKRTDFGVEAESSAGVRVYHFRPEEFINISLVSIYVKCYVQTTVAVNETRGREFDFGNGHSLFS
jgi:hypothetical protein